MSTFTDHIGTINDNFKDDTHVADMPGGTHAARPASSFRVVDPETEYRYWEDNYVSGDYARLNAEKPFKKTYGPAYQYGAETYNRMQGAPFESIPEAVLQDGWGAFLHESELAWEHAKDAVKDAYERLFHADGAK